MTLQTVGCTVSVNNGASRVDDAWPRNVAEMAHEDFFVNFKASLLRRSCFLGRATIKLKQRFIVIRKVNFPCIGLSN